MKQVPALLAALMVLIFQWAALSFADAQQKPTRQSALEAFSRADYEQASHEFSALLVSYPKDPLYRYYSGVCLVKLERDPEEAVKILAQARQGSAVVRTIPSDALFWLGRAQQQSGRYDEALKSYNEFTELYGKKAARDLDIPSYIQQCNERTGILTGTKPDRLVADAREGKQSEKELKIPLPAEEKRRAEISTPETDKSVEVEFDVILAEALNLQSMADSLTAVAEELKSRLEKADSRVKPELKARIAETEKLAASYQERADVKYNEAQDLMNKKPFAEVKIPDKEPERVTVLQAGKKSTADTSGPDVSAPKLMKTIRERTDTLRSVSPAGESNTVLKEDTAVTAGIREESVRRISKPVELYSVFEIKSESDTPGKVTINPKIPPGLIYRIQIAVFRNPVIPSYFKGITPIYGFPVKGTDRTAYYAGMFRKIADARKALPAVRQKGFRDAFIVAISEGKSISMERAAVMEKQWGMKPFVVTREVKMVPSDTIPPELFFRVEVARSLKPLKDDVIEGIKKIAGVRGFDSEVLSDGTTIYLMGKFITYESAVEYADLLIRNGYRNSRVVARLGKKEVPVDKARELFDRVE